MARINRRKLKERDVVFEVRVEADESDFSDGHFDSGDPDYAEQDKAIVDDIRERLNRGDETAWCGVIVEARFEEHLGGSSIWGCSLDDTYTAEVVADEHGMRASALALLQAEVDRADRQQAGALALRTLAAIPKKTLEKWIERGFATVVPLARSELKRRKIPG